MTDEPTRQERLGVEVELLQAMYPELEWNEKHQEIKYLSASGACLVIRVPDDYPGSNYPILLSALHNDQTDLRDLTKTRIEELSLPSNEEVLDTTIQAFDETVLAHNEKIETARTAQRKDSKNEDLEFKTVVIWLHHLLNTNKRKLALNPSIDADHVTGVTKPGYPGVLVYSGHTDAIDAHVAELKDQRWQAFQIRYEEITPKVWAFKQSHGIKEVESMAEVVQEIGNKEDQTRFLQAVGVK